MWWKLVNLVKPISHCSMCSDGTAYDPIPYELKFGFGCFECACGHSWTNHSAKRSLHQDCKKCGKSVVCIWVTVPPKRPGPRHTQNQDSREGCASGTCKFLFVASRAHCSSGSTISTASIRTLASIDAADSLEARNNGFWCLADLDGDI